MEQAASTPQRSARWRRTMSALSVVAVLGTLSLGMSPADAKPKKPKTEKTTVEPVADEPVAAQSKSLDEPVLALDAMTEPVVAPTETVEAEISSDIDPETVASMERVTTQIGAREIWKEGITGEGVTVAVIDTGVSPVEALSDPDKVVAVVDLTAEADIPEARFIDNYGHGTHMIGIIAGRTPGVDPTDERAQGFLGVAPDASIVSVKVGDNTGAVDVSQVIAGIDWVVQHKDELGIRVLNLSYGTNSSQPYEIDPLSHAVERAWEAGIVVVAAAGNDGRGEGQLSNPAHDPYVIAVAASESDQWSTWIPTWATSGDRTRNPDLAAPGAHIMSLRTPGSRADTEHPEARVGDDLFLGSGSSQAAAVVSGAVALMLDARPDLTPDEVKALLRNSAQPFSTRQERLQGEGFIDVHAAAYDEIPKNVTQTWPKSDGSGSLEAARGDSHIEIDGAILTGEVTAYGSDWDGATWSGATWSGATWAGATWDGATWSGATWAGATWSGATWSGATWSGATWAGATWSGATWSGATWAGNGWLGVTWA